MNSNKLPGFLFADGFDDLFTVTPSGGGGGYSGGGQGGGGGGSFNNGSNQSNQPNINSGHGQVTISLAN